MADPDARAKAAKLKAKARARRKRKERERELAEKTPDTDLRDSAKSKRRKLQEKGKAASKSVAGTLKSVAGTLKSGAKKAKQKATGGRTTDADDVAGADRDDTAESRESRAEVFKRGLSKIGQRLGSGASAFAEQANEWEPQAPEGPGSEGENDAAAIATLAGAGFGGDGDPAVLVGVDENQDGQFQRSEIGFLGPPPETETEQTDGRTRPQSEPQSPVLPGFGMGGEPQIPMLGGSSPDTSVFGDADVGPQPRVPGFGELDDGDTEFANPYADGWVNSDGPRF